MFEDNKQRYDPGQNPTYGYEPYWQDGTWVFDQKEVEQDGNGTVSSTSMPQVCGEECNYLYTNIGEVCGRQTNNKAYKGCEEYNVVLLIRWYCDGQQVDDLSKGFRTFPTYCKFLDAQCRSKSSNRWILVHRGPCVVPQALVFKPLGRTKEPLKRLPGYFTRLADVFRNHSLASMELP
ncbi:unnamed protein product [Euphydryas editha]|nr:unnamed protein product [Euphydryas editha]